MREIVDTAEARERCSYRMKTIEPAFARIGNNEPKSARIRPFLSLENALGTSVYHIELPFHFNR